MPPNTEARVISDHKLTPRSFYHKIGLTFLGLATLTGLIYVGYAYYALPILSQEQNDRDFALILDGLEQKQKDVVYEIVPQALVELTVPEPAEITQADLLQEFTAAEKSLSTTNIEEAPSLYNMPVGDITYLEYLTNVPTEIQTPLYQMHVELRNLVASLNKKYSQVSLAERAGKPEAVRFLDAAVNTEGNLSVYPSLQVVEAHFVAEVLAKQFPSEAGQFREYARDYISAGTALGHYTAVEASVAAQLADAYIEQATKNSKAAGILQSLEE